MSTFVAKWFSGDESPRYTSLRMQRAWRACSRDSHQQNLKRRQNVWLHLSSLATTARIRSAGAGGRGDEKGRFAGGWAGNSPLDVGLTSAQRGRLSFRVGASPCPAEPAQSGKDHNASSMPPMLSMPSTHDRPSGGGETKFQAKQMRSTDECRHTRIGWRLRLDRAATQP